MLADYQQHENIIQSDQKIPLTFMLWKMKY